MAEQGRYRTVEPVTVPLDQRRPADCLNLLNRCRMVFDYIAADLESDPRQAAANMAQYVADAIGHSVTDLAPIEPMRHRCLDCGDYFEHDASSQTPLVPRPGLCLGCERPIPKGYARCPSRTCTRRTGPMCTDDCTVDCGTCKGARSTSGGEPS